MLVTNLATFCCGMASHSSMRICCKSANVVLLVTLRRTARPSWSHKCSIGLRSGLTAGHSILSTPTFWRYSDDPGSVGASVVILEDGSRSHIPKIWDRHWLQDLVPIPLCVEVSLNDYKVCLASDRDPTPHHDTAPSKRCHSVGTAICIAGPILKGQTWHLSTSFLFGESTNQTICRVADFVQAHTCDWHTSEAFNDFECQQKNLNRPFWHIFGLLYPHVCLCCSFHECPMLTSCIPLQRWLISDKNDIQHFTNWYWLRGDIMAQSQVS